MKNRIILSFIFLLPISLIIWFSYKAQLNQKIFEQQQYQIFAESQLKLIDNKIIEYFQQIEKKLLLQENFFQKNNSIDINDEGIRRWIKNSTLVKNVMIIEDQTPVFPDPDDEISAREAQFIKELEIFRNNPSLFKTQQPDEDKNFEAGKNLFSRNIAQLKQYNKSIEKYNNENGWITWYQGRNLNHLFWVKYNDRIIIFYLDRIRIMSDLIGFLPEIFQIQDSTINSKKVMVKLINSNEEVIYQWGKLNDQAEINIETMLSYPLSSWKLSWQTAAHSKMFIASWSLVIIAFISSILFLLFIFIVLKEYKRDIRLAQQRVNFVSQVSHELKTPLTNIRMYAELLENKVDLLEIDSAESDKILHFLTIITNESQRLSRLIENVLSFSKVQKQTFKIHKTPGVVDNCIDEVIDSFSAVLKQKKLQVKEEKNANERVYFDWQILEQILNNLLSNIDKYASQGKQIDISSWQDNTNTYIQIRDYGPGIDKHDQKNIFTAFYRSSSKITEGVSGTGIGLTISRKLAKLHGGDIVIKPVKTGACFVITINTENRNSEL
jgi:signal transduction histidine kinase